MWNDSQHLLELSAVPISLDEYTKTYLKMLSTIPPEPPAFMAKFRNVSRSKSPNSSRVSSAFMLTLSSPAAVVDLPRTLQRGSIVSTSTVESTSPTSQKRHKRSRRLLKRPFSPTSESSSSPQVKGSKGLPPPPPPPGGVTPGSEIDPTTIRKHRTFRRKNPQDLYDQYDDLFTHDEAIDEQDVVYANEYEHSSSDDGYPCLYIPRRRGSRFRDAPRSPPRSVPIANTIHHHLQDSKNVPEISLGGPQELNRSHDAVTPPQSKPPSVTDLGTLYPPFHLPPTPPPKMDSLIQDRLNMYMSNDGYISAIHEDTVPPSRMPDSELEFIFPGPQLGQEAQPPVSPSPSPSLLLSEDDLLEGKESHVNIGEASKDVENSGSFKLFPDTSPLLASQHSFNSHPTDMSLYQPAAAESVCVSTNEVRDTEARNFLKLFEKEVDGYESAQDATQGASPSAAVDSGATPLMRTADICAPNNEFEVSTLTDSVEATLSLINMVKGSNPPDSTLTTPSTSTDTKVVNLQSSPCVEPTASGQCDEMGEGSQERDKPDATYLQVFHQFLNDSGQNDVFIQRSDRFDALQMQRICAHRHKEYHVEPLTEVKKGKQATSASQTIKRQQQIADQMMTSIWAVMSFRWMTFDRLLISPVHGILAPKKVTEGETRVLNGDQAHPKILDLGGIPIGRLFFLFFLFQSQCKIILIAFSLFRRLGMALCI